jgi:integrase
MPVLRLDDDEAGQAYVDNQNEPGKYHLGEGLYLIVKPTGAKSFVLRYPQRKDGKLIYLEMGLGSVRDNGFAKVRERARYFRQQSAQGNDPRQKREEEARAKQRERDARKTVAQVYEDHIRSLERKVANRRGSDKTLRQAKRMIKKHILPVIGDMWMDTVEGRHCADIISAELDKGVPGTAKAVEDHGRAMFKRGQKQGWYPDNKLNPFSRNGAVGLVWDERERRPVKNMPGVPFAEIPAFVQRLIKPAGGGSGLLIADASAMVKIDRSEIIRAIHSGKLRANRGPRRESGYNSPWFITPEDLFKVWPQKGEPLNRPLIAIEAWCLLFIILMAGRPEQVRYMRWEDYDPVERIWTVPYWRHKNGLRTHKPLILPVSSAAAAAIKGAEEFQKSDLGIASDFVFAHGRALHRESKDKWERKPLGESIVQRMFDQVVDRPGLTIYGFRGEFCTWAYEQKIYRADAIEMSMGHSRRHYTDEHGRARVDVTREAYDHSQLIPERRQLMEDWGNYCMSPRPIPSQVIISPEKVAEHRRRFKNA